MACAPVLLVLICYCTCSGAQFALSQESSLTVSPGSTVKLSCSRTSGSIGGDNYPSWYQQRPGGVPLLLVYSTGASAVDVRPPGIDARFSGSVSGSRAYLTISVAEARDDAVYYCMMYAGSGTGRYTVPASDKELRQKTRPAFFFRTVGAGRVCFLDGPCRVTEFIVHHPDLQSLPLLMVPRGVASIGAEGAVAPGPG